MDTSHRAWAVVGVFLELPPTLEEVVNERREGPFDERHDARAADLEEHVRAHRFREVVEQHAGVAAGEVDAARVLVLRLLVDFDLHSRDDERVGQSLMEYAPSRDRPLVGARPVRDRG
jgi:hypothetical protein